MKIENFFLYSLAFLLGSIPTALIIALPQGVDPRKEGSKNPGATNVARLLGKKWGLLTFLGDSGKGILALFVGKLFTQKSFWEDPLLFAGIAFFSILGHLFSPFLKFRGGKGVATTIGTFLLLAPKALFFSLVPFLLGVFISGYISVGSLLLSTSLPLFIYLWKYPTEYLISSLLIGLLIWIKHRENIKRLLRGEEKSWRRAFNGR